MACAVQQQQQRQQHQHQYQHQQHQQRLKDGVWRRWWRYTHRVSGGRHKQQQQQQQQQHQQPVRDACSSSGPDACSIESMALHQFSLQRMVIHLSRSRREACRSACKGIKKAGGSRCSSSSSSPKPT
ncbi:hypothetical protein ACSSS7_002286 [Eimeria intestinalis]